MQVDKYENDIAGLERQGKTAMLMAIEGKMAGIVAVADTIKENFHEAIQSLQEWVWKCG